MHTLLLTLVLVTTPKDDLLDAADTFERALGLVERLDRSCQDVLAQNLKQAIRDSRNAAAKRGADAASVERLRLFAAGMVIGSGLSTCPSRVTQTISEGIEDLNRAHAGFARLESQALAAEDVGPGFVDDIPPRRRRGPSLGPLNVVMDSASNLDGTLAVLLTPSHVLFDAPGQVYFGTMCRAANGLASTEWVTTRAVRVPAGRMASSPSFTVRYSTLAQVDVSQGRFVCRVAVFEGASGIELASVETTIMLGTAARAGGAYRAVPPRPVAAAEPRRVVYDCGTGPNDPGCAMDRQGQRPMDATEFHGVLAMLRSTSSNLSKEKQATQTMQRSLLTAAQLGLVMDQFTSDLSRVDVVRALAHNVVNPRHALVYADKFTSSLSREEFVALLSR